MIKILFVTHSLGSGGAEKVFLMIMNGLSRSKFSIDCVLLNKVTHNAEIKDDITMRSLESGSFISSFFDVRKHIQKSNPDIVIGTVAPVNLLLVLIKISMWWKKSKPKFILRESTVLSEFRKIKGWKNKFLISLVGKIYPFYDKIICQSTDILNDLHGSFGIAKDKFVLINNPVFRSISKSGAVDHSKNGHHKFVTVGRLRKEKGHERLLDIIELYKEKNEHPFKYYIIGDGDEEMTNLISQKIDEKGLKDEVVMVGHLDDPLSFIKDANLFLQGSFFEGFPNAVLESCSVGVPIVAFNVPGGTKEIITEGKNGFLIKDKDKEAYTEGMMQALKHPFDADEIKKDTEERFSQSKILGKYEKLFEGVLTTGKN